jgi:general secretion pathway protein G
VNRHHHVAGYSLIELLVVMLLLAVLASAARPLLDMHMQRERERELKLALREIRKALDAYKDAADQGHIAVRPGSSGYPPDLPTLVRGVPDLKAPGQLRVFLRRIPRDPFAPAELQPERHWQLRSYASSHDRPEPGEDVYDVMSSSAANALNGQPLRTW